MLALLAPAVAHPQIRAMQGTVTTEAASGTDASEFHSPMVLSLPFPLADHALWKAQTWTDPNVFLALRDYRCDGITIQELQMRGTPRPGGVLAVAVRGRFKTARGQDKLVEIKVELLNGDTVAAVRRSDGLKASEGRLRSFDFDFEIPAELVHEDPATRMRVTFTDRDD